MSDLSKLSRKSKKVKVGEHEIEMATLGLDDMNLFDRLADKEITLKEQLEITKELIKKCIVGATDEEIKEMSLEYLLDLNKAIAGIHNLGMKDKEMEAKFLEEIKKKQQGKV